MKRFVAMLLIAGAATIGTTAVAGAETPGPPEDPAAAPGSAVGTRSGNGGAEFHRIAVRNVPNAEDPACGGGLLHLTALAPDTVA
jgi:hypothetical protein